MYLCHLVYLRIILTEFILMGVYCIQKQLELFNWNERIYLNSHCLYT